MISERDLPAPVETILGLDLGTNSVGWCLLSAARGKPTGILAVGSRAFDAGMEGDISAGKGESRNLRRREARQARRMLERRARRKRKLLHVLQGAGLLAEGEAREVIPEFDRDLFASYCDDHELRPDDPRRHHLAHVLPYRLRKDALDQKLEPHELGRALYHLGQRRGYRSNRKARTEDDKDKGAVKTGIAEIERAMSAAGARTLGEYFAALDPQETRIRQRWTSRQMYLDEFEKIWAAQAGHHPAILTADLRQRIRRAIFYQRPLKSVAHLVGTCALEQGKKRAALALLCAQRFRLIQQVNNCKVAPARMTSSKVRNSDPKGLLGIR